MDEIDLSLYRYKHKEVDEDVEFIEVAKPVS